MKLALLSTAVTYPPHGASVHAYQLMSRLAAAGLEIGVLEHDTNPAYRRFAPTPAGIAAMLEWADVLYVRANPGMEAHVLPHLERGLGKPVFWELNAPIKEDTLWQLRMNRRGWLRPRTRLHQWRAAYQGHRVGLAFAKHVTTAFCVSERLAQYTREVYGVRDVRVIPNGADVDQFRPEVADRSLLGAAGTDFVITWAGEAAYRWHDIARPLAVARQVRTSHPDWKFVFFAERTQLPADLPGNVIFAQRVDYLKLPPYLAAADVALCLLTGFDKNPVGDWSSPLKLYDYLASGLVVVGSRAGQTGQVIRDFDCGLAIGDSGSDLIQALETIQKNQAQAQKWRANARRAAVEHCTWAQAAEKTLAAIQKPETV